MNGVTLAFVMPFVFLCVSLVLRRLVPPTAAEKAWGDQRVRMRLQFGIAAGLLAIALWLYPAKLRDAQTYRSDWTCRQGMELSPTVRSGPCTVDAARFTAVRGGRSESLIATDEANGAELKVGIDRYKYPENAMWLAARAAPGMPGKIQSLDGKPIRVATAAGSVETGDDPFERLASTEGFAAFGAGLVIAGILEMLLARLALPPGW